MRRRYNSERPKESKRYREKGRTPHLNELCFAVEDFLEPLRVAVNVVVHHLDALI